LKYRSDVIGLRKLVFASSENHVKQLSFAFCKSQQLQFTLNNEILVLKIVTSNTNHLSDLFNVLKILLCFICEQVMDYHVSWQSAYRQLEVHADFVHCVELFGLTKAERLYKHHIGRLRDEFIAQRKNTHLHRLDVILHKLLPDLASVADRFVFMLTFL